MYLRYQLMNLFHLSRIFCIAMTGLVLLLHGCLRNTTDMEWAKLELFSPFTILSLEQDILLKQCNTLIGLRQLVPNSFFWLLLGMAICCALYFIFFGSAIVAMLRGWCIKTIWSTILFCSSYSHVCSFTVRIVFLNRYQIHIRRRSQEILQYLLILISSMASWMGSTQIYGIHTMITSSPYVYYLYF